MSSKRTRYVAMAVGAAWSCWWVSFATAEAFGTRQFTEAILFAAAMFGALALAWRWPVVGAALFVAESFASVVMFAPMWAHRFGLTQFLILFAMMPLPPLAAGILLLLSRRHAPSRERFPA